MRPLLASLACALLFMGGGVGCTIWDELEASAELMDSMTKKKEPPPAEAETPEAAAATDPLYASKQWWKGAQTLSSKQVDKSIVTCRLANGRTQFMSRPQCLAANGKPAKATR